MPPTTTQHPFMKEIYNGWKQSITNTSREELEWIAKKFGIDVETLKKKLGIDVGDRVSRAVNTYTVAPSVQDNAKSSSDDSHSGLSLNQRWFLSVKKIRQERERRDRELNRKLDDLEVNLNRMEDDLNEMRNVRRGRGKRSVGYDFEYDSYPELVDEDVVDVDVEAE